MRLLFVTCHLPYPPHSGGRLREHELLSRLTQRFHVHVAAVTKTLEAVSATKNYLILTELDNVRSRPYLVRLSGGEWVRTPVEVPAFGKVEIYGIDAEESDDYRRILAAHHLDTIFLGAPTSTDERLAKIAACSSGFLYLISRTGVTGAKDALPDDLPALLRRARAATRLPIAVGFGISLPGHVSVLGGLADAAVVGSALVAEIEKATKTGPSGSAIDAAGSALAEKVRSLKEAARHGLSRREVAP